MVISALLVRAMSRKAAMELMMTGRTIDPAEAQRLGAVTRVVTREALDGAVDEVVEGLLSHSPVVLMLGKDSFEGMADAGLDTALDRLAGGFTETALTNDAAEGLDAFLSKRDPDWSGT
jgi:enoyl-CoA hydratase/carnithine racemase